MVVGDAEVEGEFNPRNRREKRIFKNLGLQGVLDYRDMKRTVRQSGDAIGKPAMEVARYLPIAGEAIDIAEVVNAYETGKDLDGEDADYKTLAGLALAGAVIPNVIEKPLKKGYKLLKEPLKKGFKALQDSKAARAIQHSRDFGFMQNLPSTRLMDKAYEAETKATLRGVNQGEVRKAVMSGEIDNPFNNEELARAMDNLGIEPLRRSNSGFVTGSSAQNKYLHWLSRTHPDLIKKVSDGDADAIKRVWGDESLAQDFFEEAETVYRGVDLPIDNPNVEDALLRPRQSMGREARAHGEGIYTTPTPRTAATYAGEDQVGSIGTLRADMDFTTPRDLVTTLDRRTKGVGSRKGGQVLEEGLDYDTPTEDIRVFRQGDNQEGKLKLLDIVPAKGYKYLDKKFWGNSKFDPSKLDQQFIDSMEGTEAFKVAENELKALRAPEIAKLKKIASRYNAAGAAVALAEVGVALSPATIAIYKASDLFSDEPQRASNVKVNKKRPKGMAVRREAE